MNSLKWTTVKYNNNQWTTVELRLRLEFCWGVYWDVLLDLRYMTREWDCSSYNCSLNMCLYVHKHRMDDLSYNLGLHMWILLECNWIHSYANKENIFNNKVITKWIITRLINSIIQTILIKDVQLLNKS